MYKRIFYIIPLIMFSCNKGGNDDMPRCIKKSIKEFSKSGCADKAIELYTFQGKDVYVYNEGTCGADMTSEVVDDQCNSLGYLGGIAGITSINGESFSNATFVRIVWQP